MAIIRFRIRFADGYGPVWGPKVGRRTRPGSFGIDLGTVWGPFGAPKSNPNDHFRRLADRGRHPGAGQTSKTFQEYPARLPSGIQLFQGLCFVGCLVHNFRSASGAFPETQCQPGGLRCEARPSGNPDFHRHYHKGFRSNPHSGLGSSSLLYFGRVS